MATISMSSAVTRAQVFESKEEGWSETVNLTLAAPIEGMKINPETQLKEKGEVNSVSVFIGDVIKALCNGDAGVSAFLAAKNREEKLKLVPMLVANAEIDFDREYFEDENEYHTTLNKIVINENIKKLIDNALEKLFMF